jgi:hypothetical protein
MFGSLGKEVKESTVAVIRMLSGPGSKVSTSRVLFVNVFFDAVSWLPIESIR